MDISDRKRSRSTLKGFFIKNAIPTQSQFSDLIESNINQRDDGLLKSQGEPLRIEAGGDDASHKPVLSLYRSFGDEAPACVLTLNPFTTPGDVATAKAGLSIGDADGNSKFFLDATTGNIGIGTLEPLTKLHVHANSPSAAPPLGVVKSEDTGVIFSNMWRVHMENSDSCHLSIQTTHPSKYAHLNLLGPDDSGFEVGYLWRKSFLYKIRKIQKASQR